MADFVSLRQARAKHAVAATKGFTAAEKAELPGLPILVRSQGIAATLGQLSRRKEADRIAKALVDWLCSAHPSPLLKPNAPTPRAVVEAIIALPGPQVQAIEAEALAMAEALKLFGEM